MASTFYSVRRERFLNEEPYISFKKNFAAHIAECRELLSTEGPKLSSDDRRQMSWRWGVASSELQLLIGGYSAGDEPAALASKFSAVISGVESATLPGPTYRTEPFYLEEIDTYAYAMWLLSLCKLLRLDPLLPRVMALFDVAKQDNRGKDSLFEALIAKLGGQAVSVQPAGAMLKIVKAHPILHQAIEAEPKKRPLLVAEFLKKWYPSMKGCYWYNRHDKVPQNFFGYWALEAGLVTYLWDIDDKSYRDLPFYPKDLVDYARSHPQIDQAALVAAPAPAGTAALRCEANNPCPREGWWVTLAAATNNRRYFKAAELMPELHNKDIATIWYWSDKQGQ